MDEKRLLFATEGKDHTTVKAFTEDFKAHNGCPANIISACIDISKAFIKGIKEELPNAEITFDPFHLIQLMNKALGGGPHRRGEAFPRGIERQPLLFSKKP